jgi:hypothetical protein
MNTAIAMHVLGDRVGIYASLSPGVYVNGVPVAAAGITQLPSGGSLNFLPDVGFVTVTWPDGSQAQVRNFTNHLDAVIGLAPARHGRMQGLEGNFDGVADNDLATRDGTTLTSPVTRQQLYGQYAESWRISQAESLFDYFVGDTTDTYTDRTFPDALISSNQLPSGVQNVAQNICTQAGITDPVLLDDCVLDVGLTGSGSFGTIPNGTAAPQAAVQPSESSCASIAGNWAWFNGGIVMITANGTQTHTVPLDSGTWTCAGGVYTLVWQSGSTDILTLSTDGLTLSGHNLGGTIVSGVRPPSSVLADSVTDFAGVQNVANWSYGYIAPATSSDVVAMSEFVGSGGVYGRPTWFVDQNSYWTAIWSDGMAPNGTTTSGGRTPIEQWPVRRWTSTVQDFVVISGTTQKTQAVGDASIARILVDGNEVFSRSVDQTLQSFSVSTHINLGSTVDFEVQPGANDWGDTTTFTGTIVRLD